MQRVKEDRKRGARTAARKASDPERPAEEESLRKQSGASDLESRWVTDLAGEMRSVARSQGGKRGK